AASDLPAFLRTPPPTRYQITELVFHSGGRVNRWEDKAAFAPLFDYDSVPTPSVPPNAAIARDSVVDLTAKTAPDGRLHWEVPAGRWTVLRMGYSLTGAKNGPATPASSGFEVDKLSRQRVEAYFHGYTDRIAQALGPLFGKPLKYLL